MQLSKRVLEVEEDRGVRVCRGANVHREEERKQNRSQVEALLMFTKL